MLHHTVCYALCYALPYATVLCCFVLCCCAAALLACRALPYALPALPKVGRTIVRWWRGMDDDIIIGMCAAGMWHGEIECREVRSTGQRKGPEGQSF